MPGSDPRGPFNEMASDVAAARPSPVKKTPSDCPLALLPTEALPGVVSEASVSALKSTESAGKAVGALCVALVASLYYITLYPSLPGGDSGELIVASCSLGLPHPPGYPLFAMIGWLFTHIPFGSIAWRVNLFSAVCGVIASAFLYLAIFRVCLHTHYASARVDADAESESSSSDKMGKPKDQLMKADEAHSRISCGFQSPVPWAAAFATLMFALSPLVWFYSVQAEVFAVNNMFVGLLVAGAVLFWERRSDSIAMMGAFSVGLGFTNQHTLVFYAFPLCAWALFNKPSLLAPATFAKLCALGLLGLSPYIYLPIVSIKGAPLGGWGDQSDFAGFKKHFLREEYGTFRLFSGNEQRGDQLALALKMYFFNYSSQSLHLGWPLAIAGIFLIASCSKRANGGQFKGWNLLSLLLFMYVFYMVVFHILSNLPIEQALFFGVHIRFWMQPNAITAIFVGVGTLFFLLKVSKKFSGIGISPVIAIIAAVVAARIVKSWPVCDQSDNVTLRHYGEAHLGYMPKNAVMIVKGDIITNSMRYLRVCENLRPDTTHLDQSMMTYPWFKPQQQRHFVNITFPNLHYHPYEKLGYSMQQFLDKNWKPPSQRPFYLCGGWYHNELPGITDNHDSKEWGTPGYFTIPMGFCDLILKEGGREMPIKTWKEMLEKQIPAATEYFPPAIGHHADDTWEHVALTDYWSMMQKGAFWALNKGIALDASNKQSDKAKAAEYFQAALQLYEKVVNSTNPQFPGKENWAAATFKNMGIVYGRLQQFPENSGKMAAAFETYLARSDPKVDAVDQRFEMHRLVASYRTTVGYGQSGPTEEQDLVQQRHVAADFAYQESIKKQRQKTYNKK